MSQNGTYSSLYVGVSFSFGEHLFECLQEAAFLFAVFLCAFQRNADD
jgi:hypothetical protein